MSFSLFISSNMVLATKTGAVSLLSEGMIYQGALGFDVQLMVCS